MFDTILMVVIIWLLLLTAGVVYLLIMNHIQQEVNEAVDECLEELNADYDRTA